jgi:plastocyanin
MKQLFMGLFAALLLGPVVALSATPAVEIKDDAFSPPTLTIEAGQTVTFINDDDDAHTVTATDGSFDSKGLDSNGVWHHTFGRPGTYKYFCQLHPFMKGTIVVQARS